MSGNRSTVETKTYLNLSTVSVLISIDLHIYVCTLESFEPHVVCENYVCVLATQL